MLGKFWTGSFLFFLSACTQSQTKADPLNTATSPVSARFAQAEVIAFPGQNLQGSVQFEQMPNSTIATYRFEGLEPKKVYQLSVFNSPDCRVRKDRQLIGLYQFKTNKYGISESTFKTEDFSVSADRPLVGQSLAIGSLNKISKRLENIAGCGMIRAAAATTMAPAQDQQEAD